MRIASTLTVAASLAAALPAVASQDSPRDKANALIERGSVFLVNQQQDNGTWQPVEQVPPAITALVLRALIDTDQFGPDDDLIQSGYQALIAQQVADGGIYDDLLANYNTAIAVSSLSAVRDEAGDDRYKEATDKALAYLRQLQWTPETQPDFAEEEHPQQVVDESDPFYGGWGYGGRSRGAGRPDLSNTQMALEALHDAGVSPDDPAFQRAVLFVSRLQNNSETNDGAWAGDDGGFIYSPDGDRTFESQAGEFTTPDGQIRLRSYGSMTYAGLKSMIYAGLEKDDPRVEAAFKWVSENWTLDANPGMPTEEMSDYGLYYYYLTLARALDAYDQPVLDTPFGPIDWRVELIDKLEELQHDDGSWSGNAKWLENDPTLVTAYVVTALNHAMSDLHEHPVEIQQ